jgi:dihydrofolate reductase
MKSILVFVSTLDGKVTKWGDPHVRDWSSKEDQEYYKKILGEASLIIMGSNTFNADYFSPSPHRLLLVMTKHILKYKKSEVAGQIEFTDKLPAELTEKFRKKNYEVMMVVGGPHVATSFLKDGLIDELWLTIEPKIFGVGGNFVTEEKLDINLKLLSCEKVNDEGTLITKYAVIKK